MNPHEEQVRASSPSVSHDVAVTTCQSLNVCVCSVVGASVVDGASGLSDIHDANANIKITDAQIMLSFIKMVFKISLPDVSK